MGRSKLLFEKNLNQIFENRIKSNQKLNLQPWIVGLIVFGGVDPVTGFVVETNFVEVAFSEEANVNGWAEIGAVPCTMKCLDLPKVRRELGDTQDITNDLMEAVAEGNAYSCYFLTQYGYDGDPLRVELGSSRYQKKNVTTPHTREH